MHVVAEFFQAFNEDARLFIIHQLQSSADLRIGVQYRTRLKKKEKEKKDDNFHKTAAVPDVLVLLAASLC